MVKYQVHFSHAAVLLGQSLFPLFALALDLPENFFDDKVIMVSCLHMPPVADPSLSEDNEACRNHAALALPSPASE